MKVQYWNAEKNRNVLAQHYWHGEEGLVIFNFWPFLVTYFDEDPSLVCIWKIKRK